MKPQYFLGIALMAFLAFGCNKTEFAKLASNQGLVEKIKDKEGQTVAEFSYNNDLTLKSSWHHLDYYMAGNDATYKYTFNENGQLTSKSGFEPGNMIMSSMIGAMDKDVDYTYFYDKKGQLERVIIDYDYKEYTELNYTLSYSYTYPSDKLITKAINHVNPAANSIMNYEDYVKDTDGNIAEIVDYTLMSPTEKHIYSKTFFTYDAKKSPHFFEPGPTSKNNPLTKKVVAYNYDEKGMQSIAYTSEYTYEYDYNSDGYPEKMTETYPNDFQNINYYFYK
jgi:hypothetical protein